LPLLKMLIGKDREEREDIRWYKWSIQEMEMLTGEDREEREQSIVYRRML
jgi:hypothetical protein